MSDYVALLGTRGGPAIRPRSEMPTSNLIVMDGKTVLVDAGLGAARGICDQGVALTDLDAIFISHLHSDHYVELGPLLHTAWTTGLVRPLSVYGPKGLQAFWHHFQKAMSADTDLRVADEGRVDLATLVTVVEIDEGPVVDIGDLKVTALRNNHPPIEHSFAFRFETNQTRVVMSGDTTAIPEMVEFAKDADLLVHEAMLVEGVEAIVKRNPNGDDRLRTHILHSHTAAEDVARIATEAGVKALALNHLVPSDILGFGEQDWIDAVRPHWEGPVFVGHDGLRIAL